MSSQRRRRSFVLAALLSLLSAVAGALPAAAGGPYDYHPVTPCRVFDTRVVGPQTNGQPLANPGPYLYRIQGNCAIPNGAAAVTLNATVVGPSTTGDLRLTPLTTATVSTLNYPGGIGALANGATMPLAAVSQPTDKDLQVAIGMATAGTLHLIIDVTGYFQ
jgi:hypothetical protein